MIINYVFRLIDGTFTFIEFLQAVIFSMLAVMIAMCVHEFCHSLTAYLLGDKTSYSQGRMSLNPFAHMDIRGMIFLLCFGIGYAKPVRVNASRFKNPQIGMILTAAAGPLSNFLTSFIITFFYGLTAVKAYIEPDNTLFYNMEWLFGLIVIYNLFLGLFNLIPLPPLDGSKIIGELLPLKARMTYYSVERYSLYIWIGLIVLLNRTSFLSDMAYGILDWFLSLWMPVLQNIF